MEATQVNVEELGKTRRRLDVEIPREEVEAEIDRAYGRVQQHAQIRGFRAGKVPRAVLERYFGDKVRADVLSHLIERSYADAVSRNGLRPVGPPEIVPENVEAGRPLRYSATVDVWPEVRIGDHRELPARRPVRKVTDADVDRAVDQLRESLAELRPIEERQVATTGDFATVDYVASLGGKALGEGKRENRLVEVGAGQVPTEIDEGLLGMSIDESKTVEVELPEDHPDGTVAGKRVVFEVTLRGIREKVVPEADDELAKEHGECETLAELRARLHDRIAAALEAEADAAVRDQLMDELLRRNPFEVPATLVERQVEILVDELLSRLGPAAEGLRRDAERLGKIRDDFRPRAERQVRAALALDALARQESIEVGDDAVQERVEEMVSQASQNAQRLRALYGDPEAREDLRGRLRREAALASIVGSATVEEVDAAEGDVARTPEKG